MLSNLLTSILPNIPNARTVAVTISEAQWDEVLWKRNEPENDIEPEITAPQTGASDEENNDIMVYESDELNNNSQSKMDWVGLDRDKRSSYLIIGALKSEGIL